MSRSPCHLPFQIPLAALALLGAAVAANSGEQKPPSPPQVPPPYGTWHLRAADRRFTVLLAAGERGGEIAGTLIDEQGAREKLDIVGWSVDRRALALLRKPSNGRQERFALKEVDGVVSGTAFLRPIAVPERSTLDRQPVTGWNRTKLDAESHSRVFELLINQNFRGRLRLDRTADGKPVGRLKVYSTVGGGSTGEEPEQDLRITHWDGAELRFVRPLPGGDQEYRGVVVGRDVRGTFTTAARAGEYPWSGTRAEVLSYGLVPKSAAERARWQERTRRRLKLLTMDGDPAPATQVHQALREDLAPFPSRTLPPNRDDDPARHPQNYRLTEVQLGYTLQPGPIARTVHGYLARPTGKPPRGGYPVVLAVNGHGGSAWKMMNPDDRYFWHGDGFARRGYMVLAIDISHRPTYDRGGLYGGYDRGDDPEHGNGPHPAVRVGKHASQWEEDGERAWDAMRALDYLLSQPDVNRERVIVTGISMGGEVTSYVAALDPRIKLAIPVGYSPDVGVMRHNGNHPCWEWKNADVREYIDVSDLHALTAPRPLILQTGKQDYTFSRARAPFAGDLQIARRSRAAYGVEADRFVHYLHYDEHHYHVGDVNPTRETEKGVRVPVRIEPGADGASGWQSDGATRNTGKTLFELIDQLWMRSRSP